MVQGRPVGEPTGDDVVDGISPVLARRDGPVTTITLNRPNRANAIDMATRLRLLAALRAAMEDETSRALVLTGTGRHFCSGGDLRDMTRDRGVAASRMDVLGDVARAVVNGPKPVVAAVEGSAYGAGLSLAAACDYVVCSDDARFCSSFGRVGLLPDAGLLWTLPRRVGAGRARAMMLSGTVVSATTALAWGLADSVAPPGAALGAALSVAGAMARHAPATSSHTKRILALDPMSLEALLHLEREAQVELLGTQDFEEGRAAFFDRRDPTFTGG